MLPYFGSPCSIVKDTIERAILKAILTYVLLTGDDDDRWNIISSSPIFLAHTINKQRRESISKALENRESTITEVLKYGFLSF